MADDDVTYEDLEEPDEALDADWSDATPLCPGCLMVVDPLQHYCHRCGRAVGQLTPNIPFVNIPFLFEPVKIMWERAWLPQGESPARRVLYVALLVLIPFCHALGWILLLGIPFWWRRAYRLRHHLCLKCGYDIRHLADEEGVCPECGSPPLRA